MAQSMVERHLAVLEAERKRAAIEEHQKMIAMDAAKRQVTIKEEKEERVMNFALDSPDSHRYTDSPMMEDGEDITETSVASPMSTASSVSSRRRSSTSHRRKSTPKKRQWEPTVYSDGESAHEESYSDDQHEESLSYSSGDDSRFRRQVSLEDEDRDREESRLVIDERECDSPASFTSSVLSARDLQAKEAQNYFTKGTMVKDAIMAMRIKSETFDDYYQAAMGGNVGANATREAMDARLNAQNEAKSNRREHKCPFCHFVYTSVNYLLSHLYRVHFTVDPAELQRAIAGITAPFKNGQSKSTQYSRAPHMDESGRVVAPPEAVLGPLNLKTHGLDSVDGDMPPAKMARLSPSSRTSSPLSDQLNPKKRSSLACPKCTMRFSARSQFENHIRQNTCTAVDSYPFIGSPYSMISPASSPAPEAQKLDCHLCGQRFQSRFELDVHAQEHRAPTPVRCDTCDLWFSDPKALEQHRQMHDAQLKCQFCGLTFNSMETLKRHTETHFSAKTMSTSPYNQSPPSSSDSDKENSPAAKKADDKSSNANRKLLLAELQQDSDVMPQNLVIPKTEPESPDHKTADDQTPAEIKYQHSCTMCHVKCPNVTALVEHISKCHSSNNVDPKKAAHQPNPYLPWTHGLSHMTNPLMGLGGFYPGMFMQNPLLMSNFDPKSFPMQPNILMSQLTKNAAMDSSTKYHNSKNSLKPDDPNLINLLSKEKAKTVEEPPSRLSPTFPNAYIPPYASPPAPREVVAPQAPPKVDEKKNAMIQQLHEVEKPFSCTQCNKRFKRNCHLQLHKRTHTDDMRSYRCPQCGMRFIQLRSLEQHLKTHSIEKPYSCEFCGKKFAQKYNLKLHIRTHTGEKPYKCSYCEMRFADPGSLNRHTRTHTGEKPYSCDYCGKKFAQKYNLHLHIRVHTHDRPFKCVYCDKRFAQKSNLLMHLKLHVEYLQQLQNGTLPNMAELLDNGEKKGDGPVLPSEAELRIIESERKKIEDELVALEKAELADKILSEEGARREKELIFNRDELAAMGKSGLALMGIDSEKPADLTASA